MKEKYEDRHSDGETGVNGDIREEDVNRRPRWRMTYWRDEKRLWLRIQWILGERKVKHESTSIFSQFG